MADQASQGLLSGWLQARRIAAALGHVRGRVLDIGCGTGPLARHVAARDYVGFDVDAESIEIARSRYPHHVFSQSLPGPESRFDSIVCLAVLEHLPDPAATMSEWLTRLAAGGTLIATTPNPRLEWAHKAGASVGLFSNDADEEHQTMLDFTALTNLASTCGLTIAHYQRFLLGANQLVVMRARSSG